MIKNLIFGVCALLLPASFALAQGDAAAGKAKSETCAGCHGEDGNASAPIFPKLAGQHASYLIRQLSEFKSEKRIEPTMNAISSSLSDADIADLSAYFAKQKSKAEKAVATPLGEKIYRIGNAERQIPACAACHGPAGAGNPSAGYPLLAGQYSAYLGKTLHDYKTGERKSDPNQIMRGIAARLTEDEIDAVADYTAGLK
jgi:cytochrome c553